MALNLLNKTPEIPLLISLHYRERKSEISGGGRKRGDASVHVEILVIKEKTKADF